MGKFLSRFTIGAVLGLGLMWAWNRLNQNDDSFDDDDDIVEIQIGGNQPATDSVIATSAVAAKPERARVETKAAEAAPPAVSSNATKTQTSDAAAAAPTAATTSSHATKTQTSDSADTASAHAPASPPATSHSDEANNLEWVNGIGPVFNRALSDAGIRSNEDLAKSSVEALRATGINRDDEEFASWIEQARQRISGR